MSTFGSNSGGNRMPDLMRKIDSLEAEIRKLWVAVNNKPPLQQQVEAVFSYSDTLSELSGSVTSGPWLAWAPMTIAGCIMGLATTNTVDTTINILVAGEVEATVVLPAGEQVIDETLTDLNVNLGESVQVVLLGSSVGGGSHLSVMLRTQVTLNRNTSGPR